MSKAVYIYALTEPDTGEMRYIGATTKPEYRYYQHLHNFGIGNGKLKSAWIKKLLDCEKSPGFIILEECNTENAENREKQWISKAKENGWNIINIQMGGGA